jgi:O-acetyl-ADP-ribose deacetylase (regulator of RNase III)
MLIYHTGDLLQAPERVIGHGVNCRGVMGAGIALQMRQRYPQMFEEYRRCCRDHKIVPGFCYLYFAPDHKIVANLATQQFYGRDRPYARVEWIEWALRDLVQQCKELDIVEFALPKLGCNLGGLTWDQVEPVYHKFSRVRIHVYSL